VKELENLKKQVEELELKAFIYQNELYDAIRVTMLDAQIKALNMQILELMTLEQENQRATAEIA
jgi:hypothetical protein